MKYKFSIFLLPLLLSACMQLGDSPAKPANDGETVPVALSLNVAAPEDGTPSLFAGLTGESRATKSDVYHEPEDPAFDADAAIKTVLLLQFDGEDRDAQLIGQQQYFDHWPLVAANGEGFALVARSTPQTVVVIANSFGYLSLTDHTTLGNFLENENYRQIATLAGVWHDVESGGDNHHYLLMGGHHTFDSVTASTAMNLTLQRNCAKVVINVTNNAFDKTGDNKVIIEDVRLCDVNAKHYYVTDFATGAGDAFDFEDKYSNMQPMRFDAPEQAFPANDGSAQTFTYFLPANLRGTGANTDAAASQKGKNLGAPLGATCFRIYAHYGDSEEPIVYTYYLGGDLVNDFDLKPNTKYTYNITLTGKGTPANDYRIEDMGDRLTFKVDANSYMLQPPTRANKSLTYTIPVRRAMVFWNAPGVGLGVYGASGGDNEVLTLTESTEWTASFVWNKIYKADSSLAAESELLVGSVDDGTGKYVFTGKGFDPNYTGAAIAGHDPFFRIKVDSGMKGDALVALKNSSGVILWSWHLWVTDYDPDVEMTPVSGTYVYPVAGGALHRYSGTIWGAGKAYENAFIMDRNLGAKASEGAINDTRGAYYQFGRKDPFPDGAPVSWAAAGTTENITKSVHNPTTYYTYDSNNWTKYEAKTYPLGATDVIWNDPKLIGGTGHGSDNCESDKSIYDPCPPGWRVPSISAWQGLTSEWFSSPAGRYLYPGGNSASGRVWYPAAGFRQHNGAQMQQVNTLGGYWSGDWHTYSASLGQSFFFTSTEVRVSYHTMWYNARSLGFPTRCVRLR